MKLIVGLGNPGSQYAKTRHNVGFRVLDFLAEKLNTLLDRNKFKAEYTTVNLPEKWQGKFSESDDGKLLLIKPQTFMNLSGESVQGFSGFYKIPPADILVVLDDVALAVGTIRLRAGGSAGGHNGLKDISSRMGTQDYPRLRWGVGGRHQGSVQGGQSGQESQGGASGTDVRPTDLAGHVLGRFSASEELVLKEKLGTVADACLHWAGHGIESAACQYNTKA